MLERYIKKLDRQISDNKSRNLVLNDKGSDFLSNDYLGLAVNKHLNQIFKSNLDAHYNSDIQNTTGSRLLGGNLKHHEDFETWVSEIFNSETALLFNSGYTANLGLISCISDRDTIIIYDEYIHASIRDGIRLGFNKAAYSFRHNDLNHLESLLQNLNNEKCIVITETLFSMHGDAPEIDNLLQIIERFKVFLILDHAHSFPITLTIKQIAVFNNNPLVLAQVITFGKAVGSHGAVVLSSKILKTYLVNFSRPFIYTTSPNFEFVEAIKVRLQYIESEKHISYLTALDKNILLFSNLMQIERNSPIQFLKFDANQIDALKKKFKENNILLKAIHTPTVPKNEEGFRIILHAYNTALEINKLTDLLK